MTIVTDLEHLHEVDLRPTALRVAQLGVARGGLRLALAAVLPHTGDTDATRRLRLQVASTAELLVMATSGYTVGCARVHVTEVVHAGELPVFDIEPRSAEEILAVFTPPKGKDERAQWEEEQFEIHLTTDEVTITERGQIVDGRSLTMPRLAPPMRDGEDVSPDLPGVILSNMALPVGAPTIGWNGSLLSTFVRSARVYGEAGRPMWVEHHLGDGGKSYVIRLADYFVGVFLPVHLDEGDRRDHAVVMDGWAGRLSPLSRKATT